MRYQSGINRLKVSLMKIGTIFISVVLVVIMGIIYYNVKKTELEKDSSKMLDKAEWFWDHGDTDKAIWQLDIFLEIKHNNSDSTKAYLLLESYYNKIGETAKALECRKKLSQINGKTKGEENELIVSAAVPVVYNDKELDSYIITVNADYYETDSMVLKVSSANLMPAERLPGEIQDLSENLITSNGSETSGWFDVCSSQEYLTISGGFNSIIWQFKNMDGKVIVISDDVRNFNNLESHYTGNKIWSTVAIPEDAVKARVTFWLGEKTDIYNNPISINYGTYPSYAKNELSTFPLSDIKYGESLQYNSQNLKWSKFTKDGIENIDLPPVNIKPGDTISLDGVSIGSATIAYVENESNHAEILGVRWSAENTNPIGERIGDAKNLNFGYFIGNEWVGSSDVNDFDSIYPWSEIKPCNIKTDGTIVYSGEEDFTYDDSDVMVEIPKFYVKREISDGYEYIWISGEKNDGFEIDPAFVTQNGVCDKIYIGSYLTGADSVQNIGSYSGVHPIINLSLNEIKSKLSSKGDNWHELDFVTLSMIQKLYLVETACKDSQALCMGVVNLSWASCYAATDSLRATNFIELADEGSARKMAVGDAVTIFDVPEGVSYYNELTQYQNNSDWNRIITSRTTLNNDHLLYEFSGDPVIISKGTTLMMSLPHKTGDTNEMEYCTDQIGSSQDGGVSFRYRFIENLWGSVCVMLDKITIRNREIFIQYPNGKAENLDYKLTSQTGTTSEGVSPAVASIRSMGFDSKNPLFMLPNVVGNGASSVTGYCDALFYTPNELDCILTYGLTWDLRQYAGLFGYRANITSDEAKIESGSRIIYRN